ncbi:MAG TPA: ParB-like protein [Elusimicrobiota bacterium]|nr:ParB-like protein [Elusimicrobiota bacterium]
MKAISAALCLSILSLSAARAQFVAPRSAPAVVVAPAAVSASAASGRFVPALAPIPGLAAAASVPAPSAVSVAAAAAAPAAALSAAPAAAAGPETEKAPGAAHAAAALSEFSRLVDDLMSADSARSAGAAAELVKLKDAHLNAEDGSKSVKVLDLKPMQIPVGMYEVEDKAKALKAMSGKKADEWLRKKSVPVVTDYKGRKRPVDHHHEARAAWEAGHDEVYARHYFDDELHDAIKDLPKAQFYAVTRAMGLYYDRDERGVESGPSALPADTRGHTDDPYRSLAGKVRDAGGYDKTSEPFAEFKWANFFRGRVKIGPKRDDFDRAVAEALRLVHDPAAKDLPGYKAR